jgi:GNAT superfamily N-acetyltransferase
VNQEAASSICEASEAAAYRDLLSEAGLPGFGAVHAANGATTLNAPAAPSAFIVNRILGFGVGSCPADAATLDALIEPLRVSGTGFVLELAVPEPDAELTALLRARQLRRIALAQVLLRDGSPPPPRYQSWARSTGLRVEAAEPGRSSEVAAACVRNFGVPAAVGELLAAGTRGARWQRWLAFDGGAVVGASLSFVADGVGWLGWTSVDPSHRGRWVHAGIVARQLEDCAAAGCRWVTTETARSTDARPDPAHYNLLRFGFADAYTRASLAWAPPRRGAA